MEKTTLPRRCLSKWVCLWQTYAKILEYAIGSMDSWRIFIVSPMPDSGGETDATFAGLWRLDPCHTLLRSRLPRSNSLWTVIYFVRFHPFPLIFGVNPDVLSFMVFHFPQIFLDHSIPAHLTNLFVWGESSLSEKAKALEDWLRFLHKVRLFAAAYSLRNGGGFKWGFLGMEDPKNSQK